MSSNINITGLLASLINSDTDTAPISKSARNLEPVSLSTALNKGQISAENNGLTPAENPTKKAIVLQSVQGSPSATTPEEKRNWMEMIGDVLASYQVNPVNAEAITKSYVTNYSEYYVWILPDNREDIGVIPMFQGTTEVMNVKRFLKCVVKNASIEDNLIQGALVRIDYENRRLLKGAYVVSVINNEQDFANVIIKELQGVESAGGGFGACNDQGVAASHPSGDAVGTSADDLATAE